MFKTDQYWILVWARWSLYIVNWGISISIVSDYRLDDRSSIPGRGETIFPLASVSRLALMPTQLSIQWVPEVLSQWIKRGRGVMLTTHPILCRGQEWIAAISPLPLSAFMASSGTAYILHTTSHLILDLVFPILPLTLRSRKWFLVSRCSDQLLYHTGSCYHGAFSLTKGTVRVGFFPVTWSNG
jgi:hypothetical protein